MKKILYLIVLVLFSLSGFAQKREVQTASNHLKAGRLDKALEAIEKAVVHEQTMNDPRAWFYRGNIYLQIHGSDNPEFKKLDNDPLQKALESYIKTVQLDTRRQYFIELYGNVQVLSTEFFNNAVAEYNAKNYLNASAFFEKAFKSGELIEYVDTVTFYNIGFTAQLGKDYDRAIDIYKRVLAMPYEKAEVYTSLAQAYSGKGEEDKALEYILEARKKWPGDFNVLIAEINHYLQTGNTDAAKNTLSLAAEQDPDNPSLHFAIGANYNEMYNDSLRTPTEKQEAYIESVKAYKRAIELQPDYFDALYNLGALIFNEGIRIFVEADKQLSKDMDFKKYGLAETKFKEIWKEAQPYLEQALALIDESDSNYYFAVASLREMYARTNQPEKLEEINKLWEKIKKD